MVAAGLDYIWANTVGLTAGLAPDNTAPVAPLYGSDGAGGWFKVGGGAKFAQPIGSNGILTSIPVVHSLGTTDVVVSVYDVATNALVYTDVVVTDANTVTLGFATAPAANTLRVVVLGRASDQAEIFVGDLMGIEEPIRALLAKRVGAVRRDGGWVELTDPSEVVGGQRALG